MEGRQPSIEEFLNTIQFFKKALEFYANETNYLDENGRTISNLSAMEKDKGHQARFALEQHKNISEYNDMLIVQGDKMIKEIDGVDGQEKVDKLIEMLKEYKYKKK